MSTQLLPSFLPSGSEPGALALMVLPDVRALVHLAERHRSKLAKRRRLWWLVRQSVAIEQIEFAQSWKMLKFSRSPVI